MIFNQTRAGAYAGDMSGIGTVTKEGNGTLTFSGNNTYSGGTTVSAGAIRGSATSVQGDITNNSSVIFDQGTDGEYTGEMSGSGALTKQGAGRLTMTGINSYTGGTTVTAGTLAGNNLSLQGNIVNNGAVEFDQVAAGTYAGDMSGTGALTKDGAGPLILTGDNSYTGGTTVSAGALRGDADSLQGDIETRLTSTLPLDGDGNPVENTAEVIFDQSTTGIYAGSISGDGAVTMIGAGTLTMTGINTYTGGTTVSAGTLEGNSASLQGDIVNNSAVIFDQAVLGTYAGNMSGSGSLTKQGAGTFILSGTSSYVGTTMLTAGRLTVNGSVTGQTTVQNGGELTGSGRVGDLINDGLVAPGDTVGTLTVAGNYVQSSAATLQVQLSSSGPSDLLDVTGTAIVDGELIVDGPGVYTAGTTSTLLAADGGVAGTFDTVQLNFVDGTLMDSPAHLRLDQGSVPAFAERHHVRRPRRHADAGGNRRTRSMLLTRWQLATSPSHSTSSIRSQRPKSPPL